MKRPPLDEITKQKIYGVWRSGCFSLAKIGKMFDCERRSVKNAIADIEKGDRSKLVKEIEEKGRIDSDILRKRLLMVLVDGIYEGDINYIKFGLSQMKTYWIKSLAGKDGGKGEEEKEDELTENAGEVFGE